MPKLGDICIKNGTYEKGGETKNRYVNVGAIMENDNGMYVLLDPTINLAAFDREGKTSVIASVFKKDQKQESDFPDGF